MSENSKTFRCEDCGSREFTIIVEPNLPDSAVYTGWLEGCMTCPVCEGELEVIS